MMLNFMRSAQFYVLVQSLPFAGHGETDTRRKKGRPPQHKNNNVSL